MTGTMIAAAVVGAVPVTAAGMAVVVVVTATSVTTCSTGS